jgi:hypothetical protein
MNDDVKGMRAALAQRFDEEVAAIPAGQGPYGWPQSCPETWWPSGGPRLVPAVC